MTLSRILVVVSAAALVWPVYTAQSQESEDKTDEPAAVSTQQQETTEASKHKDSAEEKTSSDKDKEPLAETENETGTATPADTAEKEDTGGSGEAQPAGEGAPKSLTVASWGGAYGESQNRAYFAPFKDETGIAIVAISHNGELEALTGEDGDIPANWDIIDLGPDTLERACRDGKLEKVDAASLAAAEDGTPAREDFFPGTLHECGVPSVAWSAAVVFDKRAFKNKPPATAKDFFDVKTFPGPRALPRDPKYVFELALMADGVAPEDVYATLSSDDGVERALKQLNAIRDHIVWWERANEPLALLSRQDAVMGLAFNGRIFSAIVAENKPFGVIWDGQVFDLDFWAVPKETPHKKASLEFIAFATRPERMAHQARWFPYGPVRKSALPLVGKHPEIEVDMTTYIPTSGENFKRALRLDTSWWQEHAEAMAGRLKVWRIADGGSAESGLDAEAEMRLGR